MVLNTNNLKFTTTDFLVIERTKLSDERTVLAYLRTFIILLISGLAIIRLVFLQEIVLLGIILIALSPIVLAFGVIRFIMMKKRIRDYYKNVD